MTSIHPLSQVVYLVAAVLFILSLKGLSNPETSRRGNYFGMIGMGIAILVTLINYKAVGQILVYPAILIGGGIGAYVARRIAMTALPQLVAAFHSLVGLAAVFIAAAAFYDPVAFEIGSISGKGLRSLNLSSAIEMAIGVAIGAVTFTGSIIAFGKLQGLLPSKPVVFKGQHLLNLFFGLAIIALVTLMISYPIGGVFWAVVMLSFILGVTMIIPIGGADMPVVVSMLNSYSGWAACGIGFTLQNPLLIIAGALVGSSGAILSYIMCKAMNRSFISVILGGFGAEVSAVGQDDRRRSVKSGAAEDAAYLMKNASNVIIVPGYGLAVAQAQHALREMVDLLKAHDVEVRYAIHPVAGRMPGHMNVLLAEANVDYDEVFELEDINRDFSQTDVAFVIGANDITNPAAKKDPASPIYGMPILDVEDAKTVLFIKRSLSPGYAGIDNELFYRDNNMMLFSDAKKMCEAICKALE